MNFIPNNDTELEIDETVDFDCATLNDYFVQEIRDHGRDITITIRSPCLKDLEPLAINSVTRTIFVLEHWLKTLIDTLPGCDDDEGTKP